MPIFAESPRRRCAVALLPLALILGLAVGARKKGVEFHTIQVKPGDTLWGIANKYLEDPHRWDEIVKHNKKLSSDPTVALPGTKLRVPAHLVKPKFKAAKLTYIEGEVWHRPSGRKKWKRAKENMPLRTGDRLRTDGWSRARMRFPHGSVLNLYSKSLVIIQPDGPQGSDMKLIKGMLRALHLSLDAGPATIVPKRKDTIYEATATGDARMKVQVFKGFADVSMGNKSAIVSSGEEIELQEGSESFSPRAMLEENTSPDKMKALRSYQAQGAPRSTTNLGEFKLDVRTIKPGVPLAGFRLQISRTRDFKDVVVDRVIDADKKFRLRDSERVSGDYYWRAAPIDLLGDTGKYSDPTYVFID